MVFSQMTEESLIAALSLNPDDVAALDALGMLAARTGRLDAAFSAMHRAAELAPHDPQIQIHLAHVYHDRCEWAEAQRQYARALVLAPDDEIAHEGAAYTAMRLNDFDLAEKHRSRAFRHRVLTYSTVDCPAPTVLLLLSSYGGNVDTRPYLAAQQINVVKLIAEELHHISCLPEFDYVFNGIADGDRNVRTILSLDSLADALANCAKPILNNPKHVRRTTRAENARRFATLDGVRTPRIITVERNGDTEGVARLIGYCLPFPLLVRAPGFHTGEHFYRIENHAELVAAVALLPGDELLAMEYVDTSDANGMFRKYRMMTIGGKLYPAHLAIADSWKVHYKYARNGAVAAYQEEERSFLADPQATLGSAAMQSLHAISNMMQLDYAGIDFGLDARGRVVCFEANAAMVVAMPGTNAVDRHRRAAAERIHDAAKRLFGL